MKSGQFMCFGNLSHLRKRFSKGFEVQIKISKKVPVEKFKNDLTEEIASIEILGEIQIVFLVEKKLFFFSFRSTKRTNFLQHSIFRSFDEFSASFLDSQPEERRKTRRNLFVDANKSRADFRSARWRRRTDKTREKQEKIEKKFFFVRTFVLIDESFSFLRFSDSTKENEVTRF